jgi:hypothetical protein
MTIVLQMLIAGKGAVVIEPVIIDEYKLQKTLNAGGHRKEATVEIAGSSEVVSPDVCEPHPD